MPHDLDPMEQRRRKVGEQEARDLRAEVLRWVQEEEAGGPIRSTLASLVEQELREVVRETIDAPETSRNLQQPILDRLETVVHDKIDQALTQARFHRWLRQIVKEEVERALPRESAAPARTRPTREAAEENMWRDPAVRPAEGRRAGAGSQATAGASPPRGGDWEEAAAASVGAGPFAGAAHAERQRRWWPAGAPSPITVVWVALAVAVVFGLGLAGWLVREKLDPGRDESVAAVDDAGAGAGTSETAGGAPEPDATGGAAAANPLSSAWRPIVAALPAALQPSAEEDPLACWFPPHVLSSLHGLAANPPREGLGIRLRNTFPFCIGDYAVAQGRPNLVVAAAQQAGRRYLAAERERGYRGCRAVPSPPNVATVAVDGLSGPGTSSLLNAVLTCHGLAEALTVSPTSDVSHYLFVLFLALDGLDAAA